ncbi:adenosine deaminase [Meridianimarinicoccus roseus]|uniref:Adenosine deaminase n=1 Tax=Meridianimarinicoccus roseus TaxID=2072018 RepID=A0A2V2LEL1_9RHOB|nr:adenosine deaminase [Meridianimarinicoccus roseus]PWR04010.1 adenosine deaminase [Meridianimarinicoccus roseus]
MDNGEGGAAGAGGDGSATDNGPRIELHLHLEGAAPPGFIRDLAKRRHVDIGQIFAPDGGYAFRDFAHFLEVYEAAASVLRGPEDYHRLTLAVLEAQAEQGVIYTEAFLCPQFCGGGDVAAWRDYVAAAYDAAALAESRLGTRLRIIATAVRHTGPDAAKRAALCAAETAGAFVTGFGLAGDETAGRPRDFAYAFDMAREAGLGLTAHAGEWDGPSSVRAVLDDLRVTRIGHGVRAIEDTALVARLAADGIVLEVCPGSNIALGVYPGWAAHPVNRLRGAGVPVTLSTDDPPFFRTALGREYARLADAFGWDAATFAAINRTAAGAAFCDAATRADLIKQLEPADE